jgi:hypothetical protein
MIGNLSSDYDTECSVFGDHKRYETIYFRFHFKITQDKKNRRACKYYVVRTFAFASMRLVPEKPDRGPPICSLHYVFHRCLAH